jgi:hypothetical protein
VLAKGKKFTKRAFDQASSIDVWHARKWRHLSAGAFTSNAKQLLKVYLHNPTDCVVGQKIGLILSVKIVSYDTIRCCTTQFSLISVGLCKYPVRIGDCPGGVVYIIANWTEVFRFESHQIVKSLGLALCTAVLCNLNRIIIVYVIPRSIWQPWGPFLTSPLWPPGAKLSPRGKFCPLGWSYPEGKILSLHLHSYKQ